MNEVSPGHSLRCVSLIQAVRDMVVTPAMLGANRYLLGPQSAQAPETAHCVYGEELCWAAARLNDDDSWKVLQNPESYLCFSLVVFMFYHNSTDFADGYLKVGDDAAPIRQSSTRGSAGSVRTLADCVYSISDRTVKDIWDKYKDRLVSGPMVGCKESTDQSRKHRLERGGSDSDRARQRVKTRTGPQEVRDKSKHRFV